MSYYLPEYYPHDYEPPNYRLRDLRRYNSRSGFGQTDAAAATQPAATLAAPVSVPAATLGAPAVTLAPPTPQPATTLSPATAAPTLNATSATPTGATQGTIVTPTNFQTIASSIRNLEQAATDLLTVAQRQNLTGFGEQYRRRRYTPTEGFGYYDDYGMDFGAGEYYDSDSSDYDYDDY